MTIHDLRIEGVSLDETEAETPSVVDADAVRASAVAPQRFEPVAGRHAKEVECRGRARLRELAPSYPFEADEAPYPKTASEPPGVPAAEAPDH